MKSKSTPILVRLASNTTWLFLERGISIAISVGVGLYFVRYLGPVDFGAYSYALGLYWLFSAASKLGVNALAVNEAVQSGPKQAAVLGSVFTLRMTASLLCIPLINVTAYLLGDGPFSRQMTFIFSIGLLFGPFETITHWFEAAANMKPVAVARSLTSILIALCRLALMLAGFSLFWLSWLVPIEGAVVSLFLILAYRTQNLYLWEWNASAALMKKFIREGAPLFVSALAVITYMKIDQVMLGKMTSSEEVGIYSAAVRISEMFYFVPVMLAGLLFPYLIKANRRGDYLFRRLFQVMCDGFAWIALIIAVPVTLFSVQIISLAYGADYLPAAKILVVHVWAGLFVFLETLRSRWLVIYKITYVQLYTTALGAVTNVLLNFYLIPLYQGYGAAIATTVSYGLAVVFSCFLHKRTWDIGTVLVKALLAPLRIPETLRTYKVVRGIVDDEEPQRE